MGLTRKQTIEEFRKMWNWIADETEKVKKYVNKHAYLDTHGFRGIEFGCFLCDYTKLPDEDDPFIKYHVSGSCACCPICFDDINNPPDLSMRGCGNGWYGKYIAIPEENWEELARVARIIANLPEREVSHE